MINLGNKGLGRFIPFTFRSIISLDYKLCRCRLPLSPGSFSKKNLSSIYQYFTRMSELETNIKIILNSDSVSSMLKKVAELLKEKNSEPPKRWLDSNEAMELLGVSKNTFQKLRDKKAIRISRPPEVGNFYYDRKSIMDYLDKHAINPE